MTNPKTYVPTEEDIADAETKSEEAKRIWLNLNGRLMSDGRLRSPLEQRALQDATQKASFTYHRLRGEYNDLIRDRDRALIDARAAELLAEATDASSMPPEGTSRSTE